MRSFVNKCINLCVWNCVSERRKNIRTYFTYLSTKTRCASHLSSSVAYERLSYSNNTTFNMRPSKIHFSQRSSIGRVSLDGKLYWRGTEMENEPDADENSIFCLHYAIYFIFTVRMVILSRFLSRFRSVRSNNNIHVSLFHLSRKTDGHKQGIQKKIQKQKCFTRCWEMKW